MTENFILSQELWGNGNIPLYYQLVSVIKRGIAADILKPGDMIPSESRICEVYNISRSTVRRALGILEKEGFVTRHRGKGTFIASPKLNRRLDNLYSFSADMRNQGLEPKSKVLEFKKEIASIDLVKTMGLIGSKKEIFKIVRIRIANDEPLLLETTYVPVHIYPQLNQWDLNRKSLYYILRVEGGVSLDTAIETYEPTTFDNKEASLLECKPGTTGFFIERIAYTDIKEVFEYTQSIIRGDRCKFQVTLNKDRVDFFRRIQNLN